MAPNFKGIRLTDRDGNTYAFQCSMDTNINLVEDILLSTQQGISKLVGYKLVIDGIYKDPEDQKIENQALFNFYKKLEVFSEGQTVSQEEFGKVMSDLLAKAKESKINQVRFKSWKGEPVEQDGRGYFLRRTIECGIPECSNKITGTIRLSLNTEGDISRGQNFEPDDKNVHRARQGSKKWLCPTCAVKSIAPPVANESLVIIPEADTPGFDFVAEKTKPKAKVSTKKEKLLKRLTELADEKSQVSAEYLRGFLSASLEVLAEVD